MDEEQAGSASKRTAVVEVDGIRFDGIDLGPPAIYYPAKDELYYVLEPHLSLVVFGFLGLRREAARYINCPSGKVLFEGLTYARAIAVVNPEYAKQVEERNDRMLERGRAIHAHRASDSGTEGRDDEA